MIGRQVSHFYILRTLGSGGMGVVYEAQDTRLPRSVAVKILKPALAASADALKRFKREARLASSLNHPNICTILEVGEDRGHSFIVMELLQGRSLRARLTDGKLPAHEIVDIAGQIANGLAVAHDQGIMHRDLTPGNIFLSDSGLVKLLDFGLAKHFPSPDSDDELSESLTATGTVIGTIHYMAPEQLQHDASVDYRCDLFSLGAILYQMAAGARPFALTPRSALMAMIRDQQPVPLRQLAPEHPVELHRIIATLLAKHPADRYQSARVLASDLARLGASDRDAVAPASPPHNSGQASVAVLPFDIIGLADANGQVLRDGLAEDISSRLSELADLRVAPRTSTRRLAGASLREIGRDLSVDLVVEGSIQQAGGQLRVTANLVEAVHERSAAPPVRIDCRMSSGLETQDEIAREICDRLAPALLRLARKRETSSADAFHAYQRALHHWNDCFAGGWRRAIEHLEYAIECDPMFARAHVALANAYNFAGFYCLMKPGLSFSVAARAARRALAIDETLAAAHREHALAKFGGDWDWDGSEAGFRRALALDADDALTHAYYSWLLILLGREDAALAEAQKAQALAPSSRLVATARAQTLYIGGRCDDAIAVCNECLQADPTYVFAIHLRGLCYLATSEREGALMDLEAAARLSHRTPFYLGLLGRCYGQFGMRDEALALVDELQNLPRDTYVPPQCYVFIYAGLAEQQRALAHQEAAYVDGASPFNYLAPSIRSLYALDPYHKRRLEQMRLAI